MESAVKIPGGGMVEVWLGRAEQQNTHTPLPREGTASQKPSGAVTASPGEWRCPSLSRAQVSAAQHASKAVLATRPSAPSFAPPPAARLTTHLQSWCTKASRLLPAQGAHILGVSQGLEPFQGPPSQPIAVQGREPL